MRIRDWSSDVCSSDLKRRAPSEPPRSHLRDEIAKLLVDRLHLRFVTLCRLLARVELAHHHFEERGGTAEEGAPHLGELNVRRSEEHTSELQSLMRISYAVFCLKKKKTPNATYTTI